MALLDDVKQALRVSSDAFNTEITDLIAACEDELKLSGLLVIDETDSLVKRAITVYCKANFGYDNADADKLQKAYELIKSRLSMSAEHVYYTVTINAEDQCKVKFDGVTKETNDSGTVEFYCRAKNHVAYMVDSGDELYVDVTGDTTIDV